MDILLHDSTLWVAISFVIFMLAAFVLGRKIIITSLDAKIALIRSEIETSDRLRTEALELLSQYKDKQKNATIEAQEIIAKATAQAGIIQTQLDAEFEESLKRRELMLKNRIQQMQDQARDDIRKYAAELAMSATAEIIQQKMDAERSAQLIDQSITAIGKQLN